MIVKDGFASESLHDAVASMARDIPWFWLDDAAGDGSGHSIDEYGFYHLAFHDELGPSPAFDLVADVVDLIEPTFGLPVTRLIRARFGLLTNVGSPVVHRAHRDFDYNHQTVLWYIGDSDGDTVFYDDDMRPETRNPHTRNQAVLFDGGVWHSSSCPTAHASRLTLNVNFQ